ncbi:MAG: hypothetical protein GY835_16360 [bacterium]|nr:hypothetical protein [bacterium]
MNTKRNTLLFALVAVLILSGLVAVGRAQEPDPQPAAQAGMGTAFTYQGRLTTNDEPANGVFEFHFTLYDNSSGSAQVGLFLCRRGMMF